MRIVTGYRGEPHITSNATQAFNQGTVGSGNYVFNVGQKFEADLTNVNTVTISDGEGIMQGVHFRIDPGDSETVNIANGTVDMYRIDLICARYTKNTITGIEDVQIVVIQGEEDDTEATAPDYNEGDILTGATIVDFPLYEVSLDGLTPSLTALFSTITPFSESDGMFKIVQYRGSYSLTANQSKGITGSDVQYSSPPTGYKPVAIAHFDAENNNVLFRYIQITGYGSSTLAVVRNIENSSQSGTFTIQILFVKDFAVSS